MARELYELTCPFIKICPVAHQKCYGWYPVECSLFWELSEKQKRYLQELVKTLKAKILSGESE